MRNNSRKNIKNDKRTKIIALVIMFSIFIVYAVFELTADNSILSSSQPKKSTLIETNVFVDYDINSNSFFHSYGKGFFHITKDGVKYKTDDGQSKYDFAYTMSSAPVYVANSGVIGVTEAYGRNLYAFNTSGSLYKKQMEGQILTFSINKNGYSAVITKNGNDYKLDVFNDKGFSINSGEFPDNNIFPVSVDISNDNRILAIGFVNINNVQINSEIVFSYINQSESIKYADGIFANKTFENQFVSVIKFGEDNNFAVISDKEINVIRIEQSGKYTQVWNKTLTNKIDVRSFNDGKGFALAYGEPLINMDGLVPGTVELYNFSSGKVFSYTAEGNVTHLSAFSNSILVGVGRKFVACSKNSELWTYNATQDVRQLLFINNTNTVLFAAGSKATVMKLGKE